MTMLETVNALALRFVAQMPTRFRVALNEDDETVNPEPEAAHFLKLDEKRIGRDFELYNLMATVTGESHTTIALLEELVLPLKTDATEAFKEGIIFLRDSKDVFGEAKGKEWIELLDGML